MSKINKEGVVVIGVYGAGYRHDRIIHLVKLNHRGKPSVGVGEVVFPENLLGKQVIFKIEVIE